MRIIALLSIAFISVIFSYCIQFTYAIEPLLHDKDLKIEKVYEGLSFPVSISFLGDNDILVLEKNNGTVNRIINGQMIDKSLLQVNVDNTGEGGLVGSAVHVNSSGKTNVYLYYIE
jgi:aldose sugar dehydrogenase